ncbi:MAG: metalloregulator ArsR/SmtB family transcription factor [Bacteroidetes bacterium]|nr:MAG: metalloregulator ArsR/SmtB family transcription factor [Bacteroidota bacterium]
MNHREFKNRINEQFTIVAKAVSSPSRFELLDLLAQGERTVEELAQASDLTPANASQHLQALRKAGLVASRKDGLHVFYRLVEPEVFRLIEVIREIAAKQLAEVDRLVDMFLTNRKTLESVTIHELLARTEDPALFILDVRPRLEYEQGHIAGSRSIPLDELAARLQEISPEQEIVAYCRGPYCVLADEAVDLLLAQGYQVRRLQAGYPEWALADLPIEA